MLLTRMYGNLSKNLAGGSPLDLQGLNPITGDELDWEADGMIPEEFATVVPTNDWFDAIGFRSPQQAQEAMGSLNLSSITAAGPGRQGSGGDWFRTGQAPNNYANRHHPLYQARAAFVAEQVAPTIQKLFPGMSVQGQNYYRPPGGGGGQAANSDHQSAGALDIFGTPEQMAAVRDWLVLQPWVSFVRYNSPHHYDHVHVSIDLGWVAQNAYGGTPPPIGEATDADRAGAEPTTPAPKLPPTRGAGVRPV